MKRRLPVGIAVIAVLGLVAGGVIVHLTPDHRTTFLVDASSSPDFREVADAVSAAAANMPPRLTTSRASTRSVAR